MRNLKPETNLSHQQARHYLHVGRGQLMQAEQAVLDSHLATCTDCHRYAAEAAGLQSRLAQTMRRRWQNHYPSPVIKAQVQARLRRKIWQRHLWRFANSVAAATATLLLVVALGWLVWHIRPLPDTPVASVTLTAPASPQSPVEGTGNRSALPGLATLPPLPTQAPTATPYPIPASCPVTLPNGNPPPGQPPSPNYHGNGQLWTSLLPNGVLVPPENVRSDGKLTYNWWWWRGQRGQLSVQGRRLDDLAAPPLEAEITPGFGDSGHQDSWLIFPSEGCWEVTGQVGQAELTFVVYVIKE